MDVDGRKEIEVEGLSPSLKCLIEMQSALQNGETVRAGLRQYLSERDPKDLFAKQVGAFLFAWDQGQDWRAAIRSVREAHRRTLLEVAASGLSGQSILPHLESLKAEIVDAAELEIESHLEMLPLKMLVPLLLFQFPAFLLLLFGPLLRHLIEELNR